MHPRAGEGGHDGELGVFLGRRCYRLPLPQILRAACGLRLWPSGVPPHLQGKLDHRHNWWANCCHFRALCPVTNRKIRPALLELNSRCFFASAIFSFFGIALGGWIGYLIAGFIGACLLIWIVRALRGRTA